MSKYFLVKIKLLKKNYSNYLKKKTKYVSELVHVFSSSCFLVIFYTLSNSVSLVILVLLHSSILDSLLCVVCCVFLFRSFVCCPSVCLYTCCCQWVNVFCCCEPYSTSLSLSLCIFKQCYCKGLNVRDVVRLKSSVELLGPQKLFKRFRNGKCVACS